MICLDLTTGTKLTQAPPAVIALGNFDGVHIAHRALIRAAAELAAQAQQQRSEQVRVGVLYFDCLPESILPNASPVPSLVSAERKQELLACAGAELAYLFPFSELMDFSPERFICEILKERCRAVGAVCGFNYRFGKCAAGSPEDLISHFPNCHQIVSRITLEGETVSSSRIRQLITGGQIELANRMLGEPYEIHSPVVHGKRLGRKIGFPTINQVLPMDGSRVIPRYGVYASQTEIDGCVYPSVSNIGVRPTVETTDRLTCETYIHTYHGDLYGKSPRVRLFHFLRGEQRFSSVEELRRAIETDTQTSIAYFQ